MKPIPSLLFIFLINISLFGQNSLEYTLKKGNTFTIKQNAEQIITQEFEGTKHEIINKIDGILEFQVLEKKENNYKIAFTFKDINLLMTSSIQGELMNVKAKDFSEEDAQSKIFNSLLDTPVEITLSKTGDIIKVIGGDSLISKMVDMSGIEDEFSKSLMTKSLEKDFGSEALSNNYKQMTFFYPEKEVVIGDTWQNKYSGKLNTINTWTLSDITSSNTFIDGKAAVTMNVNEETTSMELTGTQETKIIADAASGFIKKMEVEGMSQGTSTMAHIEGAIIPTSIKSIITYELIK